MNVLYPYPTHENSDCSRDISPHIEMKRDTTAFESFFPVMKIDPTQKVSLSRNLSLFMTRVGPLLEARGIAKESIMVTGTSMLSRETL